jgi:hypothetical protein
MRIDEYHVSVYFFQHVIAIRWAPEVKSVIKQLDNVHAKMASLVYDAIVVSRVISKLSRLLRRVSVRQLCSLFSVRRRFSSIIEKLVPQLSNVYSIYNQDDNTHRYHEQDADETDNDVYTSSSDTSTTTTTTTSTTTMALTTTVTVTDLTLTEYNPSIDMGQYCGACRYYSRRLHFKKYCKRDYSRLQHSFLTYSFV